MAAKQKRVLWVRHMIRNPGMKPWVWVMLAGPEGVLQLGRFATLKEVQGAGWFRVRLDLMFVDDFPPGAEGLEHVPIWKPCLNTTSDSFTPHSALLDVGGRVYMMPALRFDVVLQQLQGTAHVQGGHIDPDKKDDASEPSLKNASTTSF